MVLVVVYQLYFTFTFHADIIAVACLGLQLVISPRPLNRKLAWLGRGAIVTLVVLFVYSFLPASGFVKATLSPTTLTQRWRSLLDGPEGNPTSIISVISPRISRC